MGMVEMWDQAFRDLENLVTYGPIAPMRNISSLRLQFQFGCFDKTWWKSGTQTRNSRDTHNPWNCHEGNEL